MFSEIINLSTPGKILFEIFNLPTPENVFWKLNLYTRESLFQIFNLSTPEVFAEIFNLSTPGDFFYTVKINLSKGNTPAEGGGKFSFVG